MYRFCCKKQNYSLLSATTFCNLQQPDVWFVGGKTRNITTQLVFQQCHKTSCAFYHTLTEMPFTRFTVYIRHKAKKKAMGKEAKIIGWTVSSCVALMAKPLWCHGTAVHLWQETKNKIIHINWNFILKFSTMESSCDGLTSCVVKNVSF